VHYLKYDGAIAIALLRRRGLTDSTLADFDELVAGLADRIEELQCASTVSSVSARH
jgi:hypothetical protein